MPDSSPSRVLAEQLRDDIRTGRLAPGTRIRSERILAATHHIARNTAREAVRILTAEGLVTTRHGAGSWVTTHLEPVPLTIPTDAGVPTDPVPLPAIVVDRFGLDPDVAAMCTRYVPDDASCIHHTWTFQSGRARARVWEEITARTPSPTETATMTVPAGVWVLQRLRIWQDADAVVTAVEQTVTRADRHTLGNDTVA